MMEVNIHGMKFLEATLEICGRIEEAHAQGEDGIKIIHGFNRGSSIRRYVRSNMVRDMKRYSAVVPNINLDCLDPGVTVVTFDNT